MDSVSSTRAVLDEIEADRLYADLQREVGERARGARTLDDVEDIARQVRLLRLHQPRTADIVASADLDGAHFVEHGFVTEQGFVGIEDARVVCEEHEALTSWPCPDLADLVAAVRPQPQALVP